MEVKNQNDKNYINDNEILIHYIELMKDKHNDQKQKIENIRKRSSIIISFLSIPFFQSILSIRISNLPCILQTLFVIAVLSLFFSIIVLIFGILWKVEFICFDLCDSDYYTKIKDETHTDYYNETIKSYATTITKNNEVYKKLEWYFTVAICMSLFYLILLTIIVFSKV